ncbi:DUF87 domain-containing protein [Halobacteria archaeon HArc-gm2]|nr:DUF87 domain-containing protein [Halobacteria archaeon HArc-gm2]
MAETEHITVATTSPGVGGAEEPGKSVDLPVVELLTGRGFVTGKSGSGKSNTASVIAEKLLDNGFGMLIVDIDGEYYGLKEEYEILHAGADDECDIQVTAEHAEKIASLALEQNVPIILDISSFLDGDEAEELLKEVARHLFAKAKKQKQPFLMLVEECHEWIPENGSVGEVGKMLIKIGKRGRKHGLGMVGISQRPADVKKDYITQCDWLVWHRLTWNNDTKVVGRIIDSQYADAVEDLDDGEAFLMTDWSESIRRVQFHRKQTFDAGATPGLDDFERPELKSVSDDLVSELSEISEEKQQTEDRVKELREQLDEKNSRIAELETELQDARDMRKMAEQFTDALLQHVDGYNPGRTEKEKQRRRRARWEEDDGEKAAESSPDDATATADAASEPDEPSTDHTSGGGFGDAFGMFADDGAAMAGGDDGGAPGSDDAASAAAASATGDAASASNGEGENGDGATAAVDFDFEPQDFTDDASDGGQSTASANGTESRQSTASNGSASSSQSKESGGALLVERESSEPDYETPAFLHDVESDLRELDEKAQRMLQYYVEQGPDTPLNAHFSAGGSGDRTRAYAYNRQLRLGGFIEHASCGRYESVLRELVTDEAPADLSAPDIADAVADLREIVDASA